MVTPVQIIKRKRAIARYFAKHGWRKGGMNFAPVAGPWYRRNIKRIQRHEWPKHPADGIAHANVLAVLFPPKPKSVGLRALEIGKSYVGTTEHPPSSNRGPVVDSFLAACGFYFRKGQPGVPWCGCFVTKCLRLAGYKGKGWNMAYVPAWVAAAHEGIGGLRVVSAAAAEPGDIACYDWNRDRLADHIGFVRTAPKNGRFGAREGNTASDDAGDQSNGGCVADKERDVSSVICFIRIDQES